MTKDAEVTRNLVKTLENGKEGFTRAAEKLAESERPDMARLFTEFAEQRATFAQDLRSMAASYGDETPDSGSMAGAIHRGWMSVKDALSGSDPGAVLDAAEQGEDHAVSEYEGSLAAEISQGLRLVLERQYLEVKKAHDTVRSLRDVAS